MAASAFGGMLGMASGIFMVPFLTMFGDIEIHTAIGAALFRSSPARAAEGAVLEEPPDQYSAGDRTRSGDLSQRGRLWV
jgi:hypothetical protein